jgi:hypothetical protein
VKLVILRGLLNPRVRAFARPQIRFGLLAGRPNRTDRGPAVTHDLGWTATNPDRFALIRTTVAARLGG